MGNSSLYLSLLLCLISCLVVAWSSPLEDFRTRGTLTKRAFYVLPVIPLRCLVTDNGDRRLLNVQAAFQAHHIPLALSICMRPGLPVVV